MDRREHASRILNYYKARNASGDGNAIWREGGIKAAERYLALASKDPIEVAEVKDFLDFLQAGLGSKFDGSAWQDMLMSVRGWKRTLEK